MEAVTSGDGVEADEAVLCAELQRELFDLQREKRTLQQKLQRHRLQQSLKQSSEPSTGKTAADRDAETLLQEQVADAASTNAKRAKVCELQRAYRIGGCAVFALNPMTVGVRFETSFEGRYLEEYFAVLVFNEQHFELSKHTLPGFLPLDRLRGEAKTNLTAFLQNTSALLQAYVCRRQKLARLRQMAVGGEDDNVLTNPSCTCAELLTHIEDDRLVKVRLLADDLTRTMFSSLTLHSTGDTRERLAALEHKVLTTDIAPVLRALAFKPICPQSTHSRGEPEETQDEP